MLVSSNRSLSGSLSRYSSMNAKKTEQKNAEAVASSTIMERFGLLF